jgi:thiol-disulfide isomerase/thioredoxin
MRLLCFSALLAILALIVAGGTAQEPPKKQDPKAKVDPKAKGKVDPKAKAEPEPEFNMKVAVKDIVLGKHVVGPKVEASDLKGKVVLVDYWGINCPPCLAAMPKTADLNAELGDFGLVVLGSHVQEGNEDDVRSVALNHRANFPISLQTRVRGAEDSRFLPHCLLFDHTGKCLFRGHPSESDSHIRKAVGAALVAAIGVEKLNASLEAIAKELRAGKSPMSQLPKVSAMRTYKGEAGEQATALLNAMTAGGRKKLELAAEKKDSDPQAAFLLIEKVPTAYKGSPLAQEATDLLNKLRKEKAVTAELAARQYIEGVKKLDQQLGAGNPDIKKPEFQKNFAPQLRQLKDKVSQMKKVWPDAQSTKDALAIAERYGVEIQ